MLLLDSGAVSWFSRSSPQVVALVKCLRSEGLWPPTVPTPVLIESLQGDSARDALANRLLKTCEVEEAVPVWLARRAAYLRRRAGRGSAVDALVVAFAEPGGAVLTSDTGDLGALAEYAQDVIVERI